MTPEELKALIDAAIQPIRDDNIALQTQIAADVAALQMKVTIDNALLQAKIDAMQINHTEATSTHANAREKELQAKRQLIDDELNAISNKTWKAPFEDNSTRNLLPRPPIEQEKKKSRFEPQKIQPRGRP